MGDSWAHTLPGLQEYFRHFLVERSVITERTSVPLVTTISDISGGQVLSRLRVFRRCRRSASVSSTRSPVNSPSFRVLWCDSARAPQSDSSAACSGILRQSEPLHLWRLLSVLSAPPRLCGLSAELLERSSVLCSDMCWCSSCRGGRSSRNSTSCPLVLAGKSHRSP